jgi:hypothetical protein
MRAWARVLVWVPAAAGFLAATWVADWVAGAAAGTAAFAVARMALELAVREATARFLAESESPALDVAELAVAARVGLDPATVIEAKAAVRAAVRRVMVARGAGLAGLCRVPASAPRVAPAAARGAAAPAAPVCRAAAGSEPGLSAAAPRDRDSACDGEHRDAGERAPRE